MELSTLKDSFSGVVQLARCAGMSVLRIYQPYVDGVSSLSPQIVTKVDGSPLTLADLMSHRTLVEGLRKLTPQIPVVSEEDAASLKYRTKFGCYWLLDPLDGTKEFISKNCEFTVNVALVKDGKAVWGVVYAPVFDAMYWGGELMGAYRQIGNSFDLLKVRKKTSQSRCCVVASKSHLNDDTKKFIETIEAGDFVQAGSSLKFCRVAEGAADIYPKLAPTCEWDTAAAQAVLEGAGGVVVDESGYPLTYGKPELLNPNFIAVADMAWLAAV